METFLPVPMKGLEYQLAGHLKEKGSITFATVDQGEHWKMEFWRSGEGVEIWALRKTEVGLTLQAIAAGGGLLVIEPPLVLLPRQVHEGDGWTSQGHLTVPPGASSEHVPIPAVKFSIHGSPATSTISSPSGDRSARSVDLDVVGEFQGKQGRATTRLWLSPGIGLVRIEIWQKSTDSLKPDRIWDVIGVKTP